LVELSVQRRVAVPGFDADADSPDGALIAFASAVAVIVRSFEPAAPRLSVTVSLAA
jgi:hypothetical protein